MRERKEFREENDRASAQGKSSMTACPRRQIDQQGGPSATGVAKRLANQRLIITQSRWLQSRLLRKNSGRPGKVRKRGARKRGTSLCLAPLRLWAFHSSFSLRQAFFLFWGLPSLHKAVCQVLPALLSAPTGLFLSGPGKVRQLTSGVGPRSTLLVTHVIPNEAIVRFQSLKRPLGTASMNLQATVFKPAKRLKQYGDKDHYSPIPTPSAGPALAWCPHPSFAKHPSPIRLNQQF